MKIINWNVGRPSKSKAIQIQKILNELNGDLVVLTETNSSIDLPKKFFRVSTEPLPTEFDGVQNKEGEYRVTVFSKYPIIKTHETFDKFTSICADLETPKGKLTIYGTIIGVFGGRGPRFKEDLNGQLLDFERLYAGRNFCIAGDFNISLSGFVYPSHEARNTMQDLFQRCGLHNMTGYLPDCVDHIVINYGFMKEKVVKMEGWNHDKTLSDHIGVAVDIN